jgi:OmcA/MtrC family decaheme c-type cytochrome
VQIPVAHEIRTKTAGEAFQFNILDVAGTAPGEFPAVTFSVTDPTNNDAPYDVQADAPFTTCAGGASRLSVNVAWSTSDYTNTGSGVLPALPIQMNPLTACGGASTANGDGSFTVTSTTAIPLTATGSAAAAIEGHPAVDVDNDGNVDRIAVTNAVAYAPITDATAAARRSVVDIVKCDDCHNQLSQHGNNRTDKPEVCVTCHNPNMTDVNRRSGGDCLADLGADDQTIDFKRMIHAMHASGTIGAPFEVCGFGNRAHTFDYVYPGRLNNCEGCHLADTYYPVDPAQVLGTTIDVNDPATPTDDLVFSPNASVCSACHIEPADIAHMELNGGDFSATKAADYTLISSEVEQCVICHGPGRAIDVKVVHEVGTFEFN